MVFKIEKKAVEWLFYILCGCSREERHMEKKKKRSGTLLSALICTEILSLVWASL